MNARLTARFLVLGTCALGIGPIAAGAQSADDGFADPNPSGAVRAMAVQPDGKILIGGSFVTLGGSEDHPYLGRINADGSFDSTFDPSRGGGQGIALGQVNALLVQPDGKVLVGSSGWIATGGVQYWNVQRFQSDGTVDPDFNPGANRDVLALAVQPDGKILVGGSFTMLGDGGTGSTPRSHLGRLNPDGSLDATFDPGADGDVSALTVQPDGGILVSGGFTMLGGGGTGSTPRSHLGRLNSDGSLDISFDPGADDHVNALALQADGKIWVGGDFSMLGGGGSGSMPRRHLGRLNPDGSLDGVDPSVSGLSVSVLNIGPDGKVLVGGFFYTVTSSWYVHQNIARLNPDGSVDEGFAALTNSDGQVFALAVQPDQKIVLGGGFSIVAHNGHGEIVSRQNLGRLYPDGSVDVAFTPGVTSSQGTVRAVAVQPDGKILLGGSFTMSFLHAPNCSNLCRFYPDGSPDVTFGANAAPNGSVNSLAVQPNGKILVGGYFTGLGQAMNNQIGRLLPDGSNDGTFFAGGGAGSGYGVWALALRPDPTSADGWSIVVGGDFTTFNG